MKFLNRFIKKGRSYNESDNKGTFQSSVEAATEYWVKRNKLKKFEPFILYKFEDVSDAVSALANLSFIKVATDTEELICTEELIYGYYELEDGNYEVILCGEALNKEKFDEAEKSFIVNNGSKINSKIPPDIVVKGINQTAAQKPAVVKKAPDVEFVIEEKAIKKGLPYTFTVYKAKTKADAVTFLQTKLVISRSHVIIVRTPHGSFGRNYNGIFTPGKNNR